MFRLSFKNELEVEDMKTETTATRLHPGKSCKPKATCLIRRLLRKKNLNFLKMPDTVQMQVFLKPPIFL